ncbi:MAG: DUF3300 domain-containing protein [Candidatus Sulfotelmatobacter sp.]
MQCSERKTSITTTFLVVALLVGWSVSPALAQEPPQHSPEQLDKLVARIALYPDPLLAQVLAAATYSDQIPAAAEWADEHHYLTGDVLAKAIADDHLSWDPSVQALLPFPSVLEMMADDMEWTRELGDAFLAQRQDVMDAVQRMRQKAKDYGYLRSNDQIIVTGGPYIEIDPVDPAFICVPVYDPLVVFWPPRPGIVVGAAISFGFVVNLGVAFRPWGWGVVRFDWGAHALFINNVVWGRTWFNRGFYVHPYADLHRWQFSDRIEGHRLIPRSAIERRAARLGLARPIERHR